MPPPVESYKKSRPIASGKVKIVASGKPSKKKLKKEKILQTVCSRSPVGGTDIPSRAGSRSRSLSPANMEKNTSSASEDNAMDLDCDIVASSDISNESPCLTAIPQLRGCLRVLLGVPRRARFRVGACWAPGAPRPVKRRPPPSRGPAYRKI